MGALTDTKVFNQNQVFIEGWYWVMRASALKVGKPKAIEILGRKLVFYRGHSGKAFAMDAYCPHMGAHLAEGKVEGDSIRCLFHYWKFNENGECTEIPCQNSSKGVPNLVTHPVGEKYGLIWLWAGDASQPRHPIPFVPELENQDVDFLLGNSFEKDCHPNVMMINAIDAQHFNSVHNLPTPLHLVPQRKNENWIMFLNDTKVPDTNWLYRRIAPFYKNTITYILSYWYASTGTVTLGPDFVHFHIMFALRPTAAGKSEGQTILITNKRRGFLGGALSYILLKLTQVVGNYFAKGDTLIFKTIKFNFRTPVKSDAAIVAFVQHAENQKSLVWTQWKPKEVAHANAIRPIESQNTPALTV